MTNTLAIVLAAVILAALGLNLAMGWELHIFLGKKLAGWIEWMAFWR